MKELIAVLEKTFPNTTISVNESEKRIKFSVSFLNKSEIKVLSDNTFDAKGVAIKRSGTNVTVIIRY